MSEFTYQGRNRNGELVKGNVSASSYQAAIDQLQQQQVTITQLQASATPKTSAVKPLIRRHKKVSAEELILFTRQLYALTKAGIPILRAIKGLSESTPSAALSECLEQVSQSLIAGADLSSALRRHPQVFSSVYISLIQVGENTGQLDQALKRMVFHLETERETRKRMKAAMRYPVMVITAMIVAMIIITLFVIPAFSGVFDKLGAELPLATRILIGASDFVQNHGLVLALLLTLTGLSIRIYIKTEEGALWWDKGKLKIPLLGSIFERIALGRFSRSFSMMMAAGVPVLQSLQTVADTVGNSYISRAIRDMRSGIERGDRLTNTAAATGLFTPLVLQMMAVGEETGAVDRLLDEVADFYDEEIDYEIKQLADAIEPVLLVFMAALVLVLALGVFLPVWDLGSVATGAASGR